MTRNISIDFLIGFCIGLILAALWAQRKLAGDDSNLKLMPQPRKRTA